MRQEILFLLLMGRELMVKPGGWGGVGNARTQDQEDPGPQYQGPFQE